MCPPSGDGSYKFESSARTGRYSRLGAMLLAVAAAGTEWAAQDTPALAGQWEVSVVDRETGQPLACQMRVLNSRGRPHRPRGVPFWHGHFVFDGSIRLKLPTGRYTFAMECGPEYHTRSGHFTIENFADDSQRIDMLRFIDMAAKGWYSGDLYVRRDPKDIELLMRAEDLHVAEVVTWWNGQSDWKGRPAPDQPLVRFDGDRFYHLMAGGHSRGGTTLLLFHLDEPLLTTGAGPDYPPPSAYLEKVRGQEAAWVDLSTPFWWDLPALVAKGQVDSIQVAHSHVGREQAICNEADGKPRDPQRYPPPMGNARWSHDVYFKLLDCGLRIPPTAGSGSGVADNPVGYNRVYVHVDGEPDYAKWWEQLRAGRVCVTNGPMLLPSVEGHLPGHVFHAEKGQELELEMGLTLSTREPISYLEIIKNGKVEHSVRLAEYAEAGRLPKVRFDQSGWFLVRAVTDLPKTYRFAMTGPYYVEFDYQRRISRSAARFFLDWVYERARQIELADSRQQREVLLYHRDGRDFWEKLVARANAE
jgi:hypothetical protein